MSNRKGFYENGSGYNDPTAGIACGREHKDEVKVKKLVDCIYKMCDLAGFHIVDRIVLKDKKSGRVWR